MQVRHRSFGELTNIIAVSISVAAILVTVFILDANSHATPQPIFIVVTPVASIPVGAIPSLSVTTAIHIAIAIHFTVAMHSPVATHLPVVATHAVITAHVTPTVIVIWMHPPVAPHFAVVGL